jgi:hypothetical protein
MKKEFRGETLFADLIGQADLMASMALRPAGEDGKIPLQRGGRTKSSE